MADRESAALIVGVGFETAGCEVSRRNVVISVYINDNLGIRDKKSFSQVGRVCDVQN